MKPAIRPYQQREIGVVGAAVRACDVKELLRVVEERIHSKYLSADRCPFRVEKKDL
jgi:hypothetical protein